MFLCAIGNVAALRRRLFCLNILIEISCIIAETSFHGGHKEFSISPVFFKKGEREGFQRARDIKTKFNEKMYLMEKKKWYSSQFNRSIYSRQQSGFGRCERIMQAKTAATFCEYTDKTLYLHGIKRKPS